MTMSKLPCAIVLLAGTASAQDLRLWYDKPARNWSAEALPLGNGRLGCMVFGGVARERRSRGRAEQRSSSAARRPARSCSSRRRSSRSAW